MPCRPGVPGWPSPQGPSRLQQSQRLIRPSESCRCCLACKQCPGVHHSPGPACRPLSQHCCPAGAKRLPCPKAGAMLIPEACVTELIHAIEGHPTPARPVPVPSKDRPAAESSRAASQLLAEAPQQHYMKPLPEHPAPRDRTGILTEAEFCGYMPRSTPRSARHPTTLLHPSCFAWCHACPAAASAWCQGYMQAQQAA